MMRKALLLLAAAMLVTMAAGAQSIAPQTLKMQHAPYALKSQYPQRFTAPARVTLEENQKIMGHYDSDSYTTDGLGITSLAGTRSLGTILTPDELSMFKGGEIVKFRVALAASTTVSRVFVAPVSANGSIATATSWTCSVKAVGWNEIELSTPYEINLADDESLMIGFDYAQTSSNYPISAVDEGEIYPTYLFYNNAWQDVGLDQYGNLSIQCVVEKDDYPDYMVNASKLSTPNYIKAGEAIPFRFYSRNLGVLASIPAEACSYGLLIDGELVATITNPTELTHNNVEIEGSIPSEGISTGQHVLTVTVESVNGEAVATAFSSSKTFTLYENGFPRQMHLLEQFTSTYCTYCPLGNSMLQILMSLRDDVAWVGIHGNMNGTDPMRTLQCDSIMQYQGGSSYPSASFNRSTGWESDDAVVTGIGYYEEYHQAAAEELSSFFDYLGESPSFATVHINSTYDAETRQAVITVDGELTPDFDDMMGPDSKLTVYITEDGVTARQLNMGQWVSNYVHNGVMRVALNSVMGSNLNRDGDSYKNEFTYTIPSAWKAENLNVVAFISRPLANALGGDYTNIYVNQANKRKLGECDEPSALRGDVNQDGEVTIDDVVDLIDILLQGDDAPLTVADCNGDGEVTIDDVVDLIDYLLSNSWSN
ncbi:MAG: Omp28-related outer membrane protein [Muribaculaceae bacterium]|nr:Omp28-related outer membrane protein [Muribaculaceae bacterium]